MDVDQMDVIQMAQAAPGQNPNTEALLQEILNALRNSTQNPAEDAFANLLPALIQCFGLIFAGYFAGRINLLTQSQGRGIGIFVGSFAMPAMLFKSMVELRFNSVDWYFLLAIFISKSVVFLVVAILTLLLVRPTHTGKIGIYGIFSTQSHDFALGIPIVQALYAHTHPEYETYLYLIAPISVAFLNPIGFLLLEIQRWREGQPGTQHSRGRALCHVMIRVFTNPIVFMTILGIVFNFIFKQQIPSTLDSLLTVLKDAFPGTALFCLGLSMVGRISSSGGKTNIITIALLISAKMLVSPFLIRELVSVLDKRNNSTSSDSLSTYGFLYGVFPTAPSVFIYATQYGCEPEMMASGMVVSTFISAPLMFISARMITLTATSKAQFTRLLNTTSFDVSIIGIVACVWVIIVFIMHRRAGTLPHKFTTGLVIFQGLAAIGMVLWRCLDQTILWQHCVHFVIFFIGVLGSRLWMAGIAVMLCLLRVRSLCFILRIHGWIILSCTLIPILLCGILLMCIHRDINAEVPSLQYGLGQEIMVTAFLSITCAITVVSLVLQQRWKRVCRKGIDIRECKQATSSSVIGNSVDSDDADLDSPVPVLTQNEEESANPSPQPLRVTAARRARRVRGRPPRNSDTPCDTCTDCGDCSTSAPASGPSVVTSIEDLVPDVMIRPGRRRIDSQSSNDPLLSLSNGTTCALQRACSVTQRSRCAELLKSYTCKNFQSDDDDEDELALLQERDELQMTRHIVLVLLLLMSTLVGLFLNIWRLMKDSQTGVYIEIEFLDSVLLFGQGVFTFAVFGLDGEMVVEPLLNRIKHWLARRWPSLAERLSRKKVHVSKLQDLPHNTRNTCVKFLKFHRDTCAKDIVSSRSRGVHSYTAAFTGRNLIDWLLEVGLCQDRGEGLTYGRHLLTGGVIEHVHQDHHFYDLPYLYHFTDGRREHGDNEP